MNRSNGEMMQEASMKKQGDNIKLPQRMVKNCQEIPQKRKEKI